MKVIPVNNYGRKRCSGTEYGGGGSNSLQFTAPRRCSFPSACLQSDGLGEARSQQRLAEAASEHAALRAPCQRFWVQRAALMCLQPIPGD